MKKRLAVLALAVLLAASSSTTAMAASGQMSPFVDLAADHWSFPYVSELHAQGVVGGIFSLPPQEKCPPGPRMQKNMKKRKIPLDIRGGTEGYEGFYH